MRGFMFSEYYYLLPYIVLIIIFIVFIFILIKNNGRWKSKFSAFEKRVNDEIERVKKEAASEIINVKKETERNIENIKKQAVKDIADAISKERNKIELEKDLLSKSTEKDLIIRVLQVLQEHNNKYDLYQKDQQHVSKDIESLANITDIILHVVDSTRNKFDTLQTDLSDINYTIKNMVDSLQTTLRDINGIISSSVESSLDESKIEIKSYIGELLDSSGYSIGYTVSEIKSTVNNLESTVSSIESTLSSVQSSVSTIEYRE